MWFMNSPSCGILVLAMGRLRSAGALTLSTGMRRGSYFVD